MVLELHTYRATKSGRKVEVMDPCQCGYCVLCTSRRQKMQQVQQRLLCVEDGDSRGGGGGGPCSAPSPLPRTRLQAPRAPEPSPRQMIGGGAAFSQWPYAMQASTQSTCQGVQQQCAPAPAPMCPPIPQQFFTTPTSFMVQSPPQIVPLMMAPQCQPCPPPPPQCKPVPKPCNEAPVEVPPATTNVECHHHHHEVTKKKFALDRCRRQQQSACSCQCQSCQHIGNCYEQDETNDVVLPSGFAQRPSRLNERMSRADLMPPFEGFASNDGGGVADKIRSFATRPIRPANFFVTGGGDNRPPANMVSEQRSGNGGTLAKVVYDSNGRGMLVDHPGVFVQSYPGYISEFLLVFLLMFMAYGLWMQRH